MNAIINNRQVRLNLRSGEIFMQNRKYTDGRWKVKSLWNIGGYLSMSIGNKDYYLHRVIYKIWNPNWDIDDSSKDNFIDHKNGHTDDNRIANLRSVTHQQNQFNTKAKGYHWSKTKKKWRAEIRLNDKHIHLGYFVLEADARNAYLEAKKIYHIITEC